MGRQFVAKDWVGMGVEVLLVAQGSDWFPPVICCEAAHVQERAIDGPAGPSCAVEPGGVDED